MPNQMLCVSVSSDWLQRNPHTSRPLFGCRKKFQGPAIVLHRRMSAWAAFPLVYGLLTPLTSQVDRAAPPIVTAALFDFDGTLAQSEDVHRRTL